MLFTITTLICVSETYIDSSISNDEKDILIKGYSLVRADHRSETQTKKESVFMIKNQ